MSDENESHSFVKKLEWELQAKNEENDKLLTRLKGYETVAKLAKEKHTENNCLKELVHQLQREKEVFDERQSSCPPPSERPVENCDEVTSPQAFNDLLSPTQVRTRANTQSSSSSSFSVIGKSSQEANIGQYKVINHSPSVPESNQPERFTSLKLSIRNADPSSLQDEQKLSSNINIRGRPVERGISERDAVSWPANNDRNEVSNLIDTLDEFVQVFPETGQSGGTNFQTSSLDQEINGSESCVASSKRGPMSMIAVGSNENFSVYTRKDKEDSGSKSIENENAEEVSSSDTVAIPTPPFGLYDGTGARPKENVNALSKTAAGSTTVVGKIDDGNTEEPLFKKNSRLMVKIPNGGDQYRINNPPYLPYGRDNSRTELSGLTSFGSTSPSVNPDRNQHPQQDTGNLNRNFVQVSQVERQTIASQVQRIKDSLLLTHGDITPTKNILMPFLTQVVMLEEKSREHQIENEQLRLLVKKFPTSFEMEEKESIGDGTKEEKWEIVSPPQGNYSVQDQTETVAEEMAEEIEILKKENVTLLSKTNKAAKKEADKSYAVLHSGRQQEKQLLEQLKQDFGNLHQEKRTLEIQLETLKGNSRTLAERLKTDPKLETELTIVKRQVTLFMEDFNKEHQERLAIEDRLQKERDANKSLENKLKKTHALLKSRDEELRRKTKQVFDLQYLNDDLKLRIEIEQRRASIYPSIDIPSPTLTHPPSTEQPDVQTAKLQSWNCSYCTFQNAGSRKKCEMCNASLKGSERRIELDSI